MLLLAHGQRCKLLQRRHAVAVREAARVFGAEFTVEGGQRAGRGAPGRELRIAWSAPAALLTVKAVIGDC